MITDFSRGSILHIVGTVAFTDLKIRMTKTVLYLLLLHFDSNLRRMFSLTCTIKWRENFVYSFTCSDQLIFWLLLSAVKFASFPLSHLFGVIEHYLWFFKVIFNFLESERFPVTPYNRYLLTKRLYFSLQKIVCICDMKPRIPTHPYEQEYLFLCCYLYLLTTKSFSTLTLNAIVLADDNSGENVNFYKIR